MARTAQNKGPDRPFMLFRSLSAMWPILVILMGALTGLMLATSLEQPEGLYWGTGSTLLSFVVAMLIHWKRVVQPMTELSSRSRRISNGEYLLRLPEQGVGDLKDVSVSLNQVLTKLTEAKAALVDGDLEADHLRRELFLMDELSLTNAALEQRISELNILFKTAQSVGSTLELRQVLNQTCATVGEFMPEVEFTIFLHNPKTDRLELTAFYGLPEEEASLVNSMSFGTNEGLVGLVHRSQESVVLDDVTTHEKYTSYKGLRRTQGSCASLPLNFGSEPLGVVNIARKTIDPYSEEAVRLFETLSNLVSVAVRNAQLFERTRALAIHDELTGLFNRRFAFQLLNTEWERSIRFGNTLSVILLDIDHFKKLNDTFGHLTGDDVLRQVAKILQESIRRTDTAGRYGGEEFLIILPKTGEEDAAKVAEKIRSSVAGHNFGEPDQVTVSGGIACTDGDFAKRPADLIAASDSMLYRAKGQGRNQMLVFGTSMPGINKMD